MTEPLEVVPMIPRADFGELCLTVSNGRETWTHLGLMEALLRIVPLPQTLRGRGVVGSKLSSGRQMVRVKWYPG